MKVLLVADEFFSWGVYGGFGAFTRKLAGELVERGVTVEAIVHRISDKQKLVGECEFIDGVKVTTLPRSKLAKWRKTDLYKTDADIIHSQCGMYDTYIAFKVNPHKKQVVTVQDFRTKKDLKTIGVTEKKSLPRQISATIIKHLYKNALHDADVVACQAHLLKPKLRENFGLKRELKYLPNFVDLPQENIQKSDEPTVVWLGRLDPIKRPGLCFETARKTPNVQFYVLGKSHDPSINIALKHQYRKLGNIHFMGFQTGTAKHEILSKSWVLINTSVYECLPVSFLEAMSHKCALLSTQNPDNYTALFGEWAYPNTNSLKDALIRLLEKNQWKRLGQKGFEHIKNVHSTDKGVEAHMKLYRELLD